MQIKSRLFRFLVTIFLAVCGILSLVVLEIFGTTSEPVAVPVPVKATWVVRIDAASLMKEELYAVFFEAKDEQLLRSIRDLAEKRIENDDEHPPLYINFRNDLVLYGIEDETNAVNYIGVLLQLEKAELFRKNIPVYLDEGQTVAVKGNTALLLMKTGKVKTDPKRQQAFTDECLNKGTLRSVDPKTAGLNEWINVQSAVFGDGGKDLNLGVRFEKQLIRLKGSFMYPGSYRTPAYSVKSTGLFMSTSIVPKGLADSINKLLPVGSYRFPELQAITIDYNGVLVENTDQGVKVLPKLNAVFEGKTPISVAGIRASVPAEYLGPKNTLILASMTYQMKQLDERTVFIGLDSNTVIREQQQSVVTLNGSLKPLADIKGSPMIMSLMEIVVPQMRPAKQFITKTDKVNFRITRGNGNLYVISGELRFSEEAFALNELTRLLVGINSIE